MLRGGNEDALLHQACGIAHARHVLSPGLNREALQVRSLKDDAGIRRGGNKSYIDGHAGVKADSCNAYRRGDSLLVSQIVPLNRVLLTAL